MKHTVWLFALMVIAAPVWAQDDDAPNDGGGALGGGGGGQGQVFTRIDSINPMDQVKTFLGKAKITLSGDQEKTLKPAVEAALKEAQDVSERLRAQFSGARGQRGQGRGEPVPEGQRRGDSGDGARRDVPGGGRGARGEGGFQRGAGGGAAFAANNPLTLELRRINDDLLTKINAALKPDQQAVLKKYQNDEIKKAGGFTALKLVMEEAGAPFASDQETQIQALYSEEARQRFQLLRESQGRPDPAKLDELEKATMAKVAKLLTPAQRKTLLDSRAKPPQQ